jgi:hypothetical protein
MQRRFRSYAIIATVAAGFAGCANYHLRSPEPNPATGYRHATLHAFLWGAIEEEKVAETCQSNAIDEVRVQTNYGYALITVVTLGIWMPMDVAWKCRKRPLDSGEI